MNIFNRIKKSEIIKIEADRVSLCAADDFERHNKFFELKDNIRMEELIKILNCDKEYALYKNSAIWAGEYDNFKCVKDNRGNWLIDKTIKARIFFKDIRNYICFERGTGKCEK